MSNVTPGLTTVTDIVNHKPDYQLEYDKSRQVIQIHTPKRKSPYELDIENCNDHASLVGDLHHLCGKAWMTAEIVSGVIEMVCDIKGLEYF